MENTTYKSPFLQEAQARGYIYQSTHPEALDQAFLEGPVSAYIGFDPTADSLHVGHALCLMVLRLMQRHGHRPIALVGDGTAQIGDPSFREEARALMTAETIAQNSAGVARSLRQFLDFDSAGSSARMLHNAAWLNRLTYLDLLRDVGVHFSVNRMLSFDSVRQRLEREQGLTFLEFNYSILQSYDFRALHRAEGVTLQIGGSDQWGNIVAGVELVRRTEGKQVFGLTLPLITTASGAKMGKSAQGARWVLAEKLPVFEYWQFWRNTEDADVGRFLKMFTDLPVAECERLGALEGAEINEAKKILATEATAICHGRAAAEEAAQTAMATFEQGRLSTALPTISLARHVLAEGLPAYRLFVETGLVKSGGEARRLIRGGGARLNDVVVADENRMITLNDLSEGVLRVSSGKKHHVIIKPA